MFQIKLLVLLILLLLSVQSLSLGQQRGLPPQEATLPSGKKVLLKGDGTWVYAPEVNNENAARTGKTVCSDVIETTVDKVTGKSFTTGRGTLIVSNDGGKTGFGILTMIGSGSIILSFTIAERGSGCVDAGDAINILFRDGSRLALSNNSKFNCDGTSTVYLGGAFGNQNALEQLKTKPVETIRVSTMKAYVERDFTAAQSQQLMEQLSCLDGARKQ